MSDTVLGKIEEVIQRDVNKRGLATDPQENLITACQGDFIRACHSLAEVERPVVAILTGFYIPDANAAETDGPMGVLLLTRALTRLGARVIIAVEGFGWDALHWSLRECNLQAATTYSESDPEEVASEEDLRNDVRLYQLPSKAEIDRQPGVWASFRHDFFRAESPTHLIAVERVGPSHTPWSLPMQARSGPDPVERFRQEVPKEHWHECHTMRGRIITEMMYPAHGFFDESWKQTPRITTIGIGDGGNEIGMGKVPWEVIARNVPGGGLVACRVPTDYNIVCGVSNWGAYGLAAGVWHLRGQPFDEQLFSAEAEHDLWEKVLQQAVLVDGVTGQRTLTVDGLSWDDYIRPLREIGDILRSANP